MLIKLLGTASAEGFPGLFCRCDVCLRSREAGGKDLRSRTTAVIDNILKIDLPPDTLHHVLAQGLDLTRIRYLLVTHSHDDHFAMNQLQYMSWMFVPKPDNSSLDIIGPDDIVAAVRGDADLSRLPIRTTAVKPGDTVQLGSWSITALAANHDPGITCLNYLITSNGATHLYATDTGWYEEETWELLKNTHMDGIIVECTKGFSNEGYNGHMSIPQVIRMREILLSSGSIVADTPFVTTHHSHLGGLLHAEREEALNPHGIKVGYDGMEFEV